MFKILTRVMIVIVSFITSSSSRRRRSSSGSGRSRSRSRRRSSSSSGSSSSSFCGPELDSMLSVRSYLYEWAGLSSKCLGFRPGVVLKVCGLVHAFARLACATAEHGEKALATQIETSKSGYPKPEVS